MQSPGGVHSGSVILPGDCALCCNPSRSRRCRTLASKENRMEQSQHRPDRHRLHGPHALQRLCARSASSSSTASGRSSRRYAHGTRSARRRLPQNWGWEEVETDWRALVARDDIDVVDICTPNNTHLEIALAAAAAGKIIICEKPLAMDAQEALQMVEAVEAERQADHGLVQLSAHSGRDARQATGGRGPSGSHLPLPGQVSAGSGRSARTCRRAAIRCGGWMRRPQAAA